MTASKTTILLFLLPAATFFLCFALTPIFGSLGMSFCDWTRTASPTWIGLDNYRRILTDIVFWRALLNNAVILVASLIVQLPCAAVLAILLSYPTPCRTLFRTAFFAPMVMPTIAIAILWLYFYAPVDGLLTRLCQQFFASETVIHWLSASAASPWLPSPSLACIFVTISWQYVGFHLVLFMAGIAAIPQDHFEAARLDGASEFQVARHVILPALKPTLAVSATLSIIGSLKYFDLIYLMGGAMAETDREVVATYIYRLAFEQGQGRFGQGSAAAVLLFVIALAVIVPLQRRQRHHAQPTRRQGDTP